MQATSFTIEDMGRPSEGLTERIVALITPEEKEDLTRACDGRSVSSMVRQILTAWTKRELARQRRERSTKGSGDD